jgi:predicted CXXCH cytochrome family protein
MKVLALSAVALMLGGAGLAMQPRDPSVRPTTRANDCSAGGCHAKDLEFRFLHAPAAVGACDVCHVYDDVAKHTFKLKHTGAAMCDFCHIGKSVPGDPGLGRVGTGRAATPGAPGEADAGREAVLLHVHDPVMKGECTSCHNPHGSNIRRLINADTVGQMCLSCHESATTHAHQHTPVAQGDCTSCHRAHTSMYAGLLVAKGQDLCLRCHENTVNMAHAPVRPPAALGGADRLANIPSAVITVARPAGTIHDPVLEDCTTCHDHHGTAHAGLLKQETVSLCGSCHEDIINTAKNARVQHSSVMDDKACMNCHSPHQSMQTHLMRNRPVETCLDCHAKETTRPDGTKIAGMSSLMASGQHLHGPLTDGQCKGCHDVHGAQHRGLLTAHYSTELYQPFSEGAYALCFTCHKSDLVKERVTTTATRFRNGDQNLHFTHIAAQDESGRSCRLCHAPHTGKSHPRLVETVAYGDWKLPMDFKETETGGSCGAGCHRGRGYDREQPLTYDVPAASTTAPRR